MLACLQWAKKNIPQFVESRRLHMTRVEKMSFFNALEELAAPDVENRQMEMVRISDHVASQLQSNAFPVAKHARCWQISSSSASTSMDSTSAPYLPVTEGLAQQLITGLVGNHFDSFVLCLPADLPDGHKC
jgi:hypothetical protein